jgi:hypothetical protein
MYVAAARRHGEARSLVELSKSPAEMIISLLQSWKVCKTAERM